MPDWMNGTYKEADFKCRALSQAIYIGNVLVIIILVSAKQVNNGKVKLFNQI